MQFKSVYISAILVAGLSAPICRGAIQEIKSFSEIQPFVDKDTLLVFDVDNTLLTPTTSIGSDQWFYCLYDVARVKPLQDKKMDSKLMKFWNRVQSKIKVRAVEPSVPGWISQQQQKGIPTLGLTARTSDILSVTRRQLASIGIKLENNTIYKGLLKISKKVLHSNDEAVFSHGVLSVGESNSKGLVFSEFLRKLKFVPKKVVYVDDREKHVKSMEVELKKAGIPYYGFRYGALDTEVKSFKCESTVPLNLFL
ncbi:MAG: DUF2608 domain-containing protein [Bdellovibrio sp.]|nr:DUF2608 domain-containing protein [Bdellovibrio sp.]